MKVQNEILNYNSFYNNHDTSVHYKGHGKLESSPASTSALHVIGHELDHLADIRSDARRKNLDVRSVDLDIKYEIREGRLIAVGGRTQAVLVEKKQNKEPENEFLYHFKEDVILDINPEMFTFQSGNFVQSSHSDVESLLRVRLNKIDTELNRLDLEVKSKEIEKEKLDEHNLSKQELASKKMKLENELEYIKNQEYLERVTKYLEQLLAKFIGVDPGIITKDMIMNSGFLVDMIV